MSIIKQNNAFFQKQIKGYANFALHTREKDNVRLTHRLLEETMGYPRKEQFRRVWYPEFP